MIRTTSWVRIAVVTMILMALASVPAVMETLPQIGTGVTQAATTGCNLAPNSAFEGGSATGFTNWALGVTSGIASFTVVDYLSGATVGNTIQSGSRSVRVNVQTPGDIYLTTTPWDLIPVNPNTTYIFTARLLSPSKAQARLQVIERTSTNGLAANRLSSGSDANIATWQTLEYQFKTTANTRYVSLRLSHSLASGTFYWDDVALWAHVAGQRCIDARHYQAQTTATSFQWCSDNVCVYTWKNKAGEFVVGNNLGSRSAYSHAGTTADAIGLLKNYRSTGTCWANPGQRCGPASGSNANYPRANFH